MLDEITTLNIIINEKTLSFGKLQSVNFLYPGSGTVTFELPNQESPYDRESVCELIKSCGGEKVKFVLTGASDSTEYFLRLNSVTLNSTGQWETMIIRAQHQ